MIFLISVGVFLILSTLVLLVYQLANAEKKVVAGRLELVVQGVPAPDERSNFNGQEKPTAGLRGVLRLVGKYLESPRWNLSLEHRLLRAGITWRSGEFLVLCGGEALLVGLLMMLVGGGSLLSGFVGAMAGFFFPAARTA